MGTVTKTIGTSGRDYSTLQAWEDALPANLVTDGNHQVGQVFNDSEFTGTTQLLLISGETTDSTHTITLTTGTGQSFRDNANAYTNALDYNAANGAAITSSVVSNVLKITGVNFVTLSNLQVKATGSYGVCFNSEACNNITVDNCLMQSAGTGNWVITTSGSSKVRNSVFIQKKSGAVTVVAGSVGTGSGCADYTNCTLVAITGITAASEAINALYSTATIKNCAMFGCTAVRAGTTTLTFTTCMTDVASPPTGCTTVTYANQFQTTTNDFRLKSGADCINAGTTDSTNAANDIIGTSRPQGSAYDIGCWELVTGDKGVRTTQPLRIGKTQFQVTCNTKGAGTIGLGVGNLTAGLTGLGTDNNSLVYKSDGTVVRNGSTVSTLLTWTTGDVISVVVDNAGHKIWFAKNTGDWNNSSSNDPAAGTGSIDISAITGDIYPVGFLATASDQITLALDAPMTKTVPDGYWPERATLTKQDNKPQQASSTPTASLVRSTGKVITASSTAIATLVRSIGKPLQASASRVAALVRQSAKIVSAASSPLATVVNSTGKLLLASSSPIASLVRQAGKLLLVAESALARLDTFFSHGAFNQDVSSQTSPVATLTRVTSKTLQVVSNLVASLVNSTSKLLQASASAVASLVIRTLKSLQASTAAVASLTAATIYALSVRASTAAVASLVRSIAKALQASVSPVASLVRSIAKSLQASPSAVASLVRSIAKALQASTSGVATLVNSTRKLLQASSGAVASLARSVGKLLQAVTSPLATLTKSITRTFQASATAIASLTRSAAISLAVVATGVATSVKQTILTRRASTDPDTSLSSSTGKGIATTTGPMSALTRVTGKPQTASSSPIATLAAIRVASVTLQAMATVLATLKRSIGKLLTVVTAPVASASKTISATLLAASSAATTLLKQSLLNLGSVVGVVGDAQTVFILATIQAIATTTSSISKVISKSISGISGAVAQLQAIGIASFTQGITIGWTALARSFTYTANALGTLFTALARSVIFTAPSLGTGFVGDPRGETFTAQARNTTFTAPLRGTTFTGVSR